MSSSSESGRSLSPLSRSDPPTSKKQRRGNPQSTRFCFTLNNYTEEELSAVQQLEHDSNPALRCLCVGQEVAPSTGTHHLQGYLETSRRMRYEALRSSFPFLKRATLLVAKGNRKQNYEYCSKEKLLLSIGSFTGSSNRTDLEDIRSSIDQGVSDLELARNNFPKWCQYRRAFQAYRALRLQESTALRLQLRVTCYWGAPGTGKTRAVYEAEKDLYIHCGGCWFDGYRGQPAVLFDDYRSGVLPFDVLLRVLDIYPIDVPVKGGFVPWRPERIYITSNLHPQHLVGTGDDYAPLGRRIHEIKEFN